MLNLYIPSVQHSPKRAPVLHHGSRSRAREPRPQGGHRSVRKERGTVPMLPPAIAQDLHCFLRILHSRYGSERRVGKDGYEYWDLKPDFKPGEVIEL
jgi:hypothetical protein